MTPIVLLTADDGPAEWLRAGQALHRVWLRAASSWVFGSLHTQPSEVAVVRGALRAHLAVAGAPQMLMQLGRAHAAPLTWRRPVADVLAWDCPRVADGHGGAGQDPVEEQRRDGRGRGDDRERAGQRVRGAPFAVPRLSRVRLDELLQELLDRVSEVMASRERLSALLEAVGTRSSATCTSPRSRGWPSSPSPMSRS
jgi:hypothetical protein